VNPAVVVEQTIIIQPGPVEGKDRSIVNYTESDTNFGHLGGVLIECFDSLICRAYLEFNLDILPEGAVISSTILELYKFENFGYSGSSSRNADVHRLNVPWE